MAANAISLMPVRGGWAVTLTDRRELARFTGPGAKRKVLGYIAVNDSPPRRPRLDHVRRFRDQLGSNCGGAGPTGGRQPMDRRTRCS